MSNKTKEFCKLIGVEYNEPFRVKYPPQDFHRWQGEKDEMEKLEKDFYVIRENGIYSGDRYTQCFQNNTTLRLLEDLITGEATVVKEPFIPELGEWYYALDMTIGIGRDYICNINTLIDRRLIKYGIIAKTIDEIIELRNQQEWWEEDNE